MPENADRPKCDCHGEPMYKHCPGWRCAVKTRARVAAHDAIHRERKRAYNTAYADAHREQLRDYARAYRLTVRGMLVDVRRNAKTRGGA